MEYTVTACAVRSKWSQRMAACRFCRALLDEKHRPDLFSTMALEKDLPGRFSGSSGKNDTSIFTRYNAWA